MGIGGVVGLIRRLARRLIHPLDLEAGGSKRNQSKQDRSEQWRFHRDSSFRQIHEIVAGFEHLDYGLPFPNRVREGLPTTRSECGEREA